MKFGMPTLLELTTLEENIELCKKLNLEFVEINMNVPEFTNDNLLKYKEVIINSGLDFTIHLNENIDFTNFDSDVRGAFKKSVIKTIEIAKELNIKKLVLHLVSGIVFTLPTEKVLIYDKYIEEYLGYVKEFRDVVEDSIGDYDVKVCIENLPEGFSDFQQKCVNELLKSDKFGLTFDIGHNHRGSMKDEGFILENIEYLKHFHIHDGRGCVSDHLVLGDGEIDINGKLTLARDVCGTCVLETKNVEALIKSVNWLKSRGYI